MGSEAHLEANMAQHTLTIHVSGGPPCIVCNIPSKIAIAAYLGESEGRMTVL
eukprot:NODE_3265_length_795_cov_6.176944_g2726_i0.p8 GENE.NODE_3265_length_795_cov_6.176944_g2726_i0~~NODE_3265_length_795_cov_6.176944_g2726_i0.p8  ORF type:complete len:52 (-),score=14.06 NODE_3265_length_795_cov_6.176944_g2726_i0:83-238(-)